MHSDPENENFTKLDINPAVKEELYKEIQRRLAPKPVDIKALFKPLALSPPQLPPRHQASTGRVTLRA